MQCIFAHRMVLLFGSCRRLCSMAEARSGQPRALPNARRRAACAWVAHLAPAAQCTRRVRTWLNRRASTVTGLFLLSCCLGQEHVRQKESNLTLAPHMSQLCSNKKKKKGLGNYALPRSQSGKWLIQVAVNFTHVPVVVPHRTYRLEICFYHCCRSCMACRLWLYKVMSWTGQAALPADVTSQHCAAQCAHGPAS